MSSAPNTPTRPAALAYFNDPEGLYKDLMDFLWEAKKNLQNPPSEQVGQRGVKILKLYAARIEAGARKELQK